MRDDLFDDDDRAQLRERGIPEAEALRQLGLFRAPPAPRRLARPCTIGDGIERIGGDEEAGLIGDFEAAAARGRALKFVPASGAASRMFQSLLASHARGIDVSRSRIDHVAAGGDPEARDLSVFLDGIERFAFARALREVLAFRGYDLDHLAMAGSAAEILDALLDPRGMGYASLPKGLLAFHREGDREVTAFEEHLAEAAATVRDAGGICRLHFTVSPEHLDRFREHLAEARPRHEARGGVRFEVAFSTQRASTDTLAADLDGAPVRDERGRLVFRPSGHGALLENVAATGGDVVLIKNIDNVQPARAREATIRWKKILGGLLVRLQEQAARHLADPGNPAAEAFAARWFGAGAADLDRPIRVCGVVRNQGEPGGGPFWVEETGHSSKQIMESAEIDLADPAQAAMFRSGTHFNPVDLVCGLRDPGGRPHDLARYVDPQSSIVTRKSHEGRPILALERPGLWNGAMARWNTVFVEVPIETFTPVKTVLDLLRPEHV